MRKKALLTAFIITVFTGCKINQHCDAYSDQQCDELYPGYNCDIQRVTLTTPQYPTTYAPVPWNYSNNTYYYPNTQSVYYVPVIIDNCDVSNSSSTTNRPRPSIYHNGPTNSGRPAIENGTNRAHRKPQNSRSSSRKIRD
jgi:hypothetical protein